MNELSLEPNMEYSRDEEKEDDPLDPSDPSQEELDNVMEEKFEGSPPPEQEKKRRDVDVTKKELRRVSACQVFLRIATVYIQDDWLPGAPVIKGNVYRIAAFGGFGSSVHAHSHIHEPIAAIFHTYSRCVGAFLIFVVQFFAPPIVFYMKTWGFRTTRRDSYNWKKWCLNPDAYEDCADYLDDWTGENNFWVAKLFGIVFMTLLCVHGCFVILDEAATWSKIDRMMKYFPNLDKGGQLFLYLDAFMNCWVVAWCSVDAYVLVGASTEMQDVLYDALSLLFLYNLDDAGGTFGFIDPKAWPSEKLGWIYKEMVRNGELGDSSDSELNEGWEGCNWHTCVFMYKVTAWFQGIATIIIPVLTVFTPFGAIAGEEPCEGS